MLASLRAALAAELEVRAAWLFGSTAGSRARRDSDVDVGVWMDGDCGFEEMADLTARLQRATALPIDLIVLDGASPTVALAAIRGIPLLTRDQRAEIEWTLQVAREAEDWAVFEASFLEERRRRRAMGLSTAQRAAVGVRIEFARGELADLVEYAALDWATYQADAKTRRNVERIAENVANAVIDVAKILLAAGSAGVPATYREVLEAMAPAGLADAATSGQLVRLAQLRNTLSRRYLDYKWQGVRRFLDTGRAVVGAWLDRCEQVAAEGGDDAPASG